MKYVSDVARDMQSVSLEILSKKRHQRVRVERFNMDNVCRVEYVTEIRMLSHSKVILK